MTITFEKADRTIVDHLKRVQNDFHPDLCDPAVTVSILMTSDVDSEGEAVATLKHRGYPAVAVIKKTSLRDRVLGAADAQLTIDAVRWDELDDKSKTAVLDHELQHLQVKRDDDGVAELDDHGRPKLVMRLHDWELGGFTAIAQRHGESAVEVQAVRACVDAGGQYFWDWDKARKLKLA